MTTGASYGLKARRQAFWSLVAQAAAVGLPGVLLAATGRAGALPSSALLSAILWTFSRVLGAAALRSVRQRPVEPSLPTRLLFQAGLAACWLPAVTALAILAGWGILAFQQEPSVLMVTAELDSTLSSICLVIGFVAFALGFWFGKPE